MTHPATNSPYLCELEPESYLPRFWKLEPSCPKCLLRFKAAAINEPVLREYDYAIHYRQGYTYDQFVEWLEEEVARADA